MSNPVVLITGALTGIGRAAAVAFARKGANVVVAGRRDEAGKTPVVRSLGFLAKRVVGHHPAKTTLPNGRSSIRWRKASPASPRR
jgi:NAD(P)-dependent dehydrogenase (short-subunit alcohol dehydrogenase family)